jgi:hypothetical protein
MKLAGGVTQVVEYLPSKYEAPSSPRNAAKKKKEERRMKLEYRDKLN